MVAKTFQHGVKFQMLVFSTANIMHKPGQYDFTAVDQDIKRHLSMAPEEILILKLRFEPVSWWMNQHPDELIDYPVAGAFGGEQTAKYRAPFFASKIWRSDMQKCLKAFINYVDKSAWGHRVAGINIASGVYSEWHYWGMFASMPDTGKTMTRRFREFLRARYQISAALQQSWDNREVTLQNAQVPNVQLRHSKFFLRAAQSADQATSDFNECLQEVVAETLLGFTTAAKKLKPNWLVGAYYGYVWGMHFPSVGQTLCIDRVLRSPSVDFLQAPYCYDLNRWLGGDALMRAIPRTFARYGKLSIW